MVLCQECNLGSKELEECLSTKSDTNQLFYVYNEGFSQCGSNVTCLF